MRNILAIGAGRGHGRGSRDGGCAEAALRGDAGAVGHAGARAGVCDGAAAARLLGRAAPQHGAFGRDRLLRGRPHGCAHRRRIGHRGSPGLALPGRPERQARRPACSCAGCVSAMA